MLYTQEQDRVGVAAKEAPPRGEYVRQCADVIDRSRRRIVYSSHTSRLTISIVNASSTSQLVASQVLLLEYEGL